MDSKEARDLLVWVVNCAAVGAGGKARLAKRLGVGPAAVSLWISRRQFPPKYMPDLAELSQVPLERVRQAMIAVHSASWAI